MSTFRRRTNLLRTENAAGLQAGVRAADKAGYATTKVKISRRDI